MQGRLLIIASAALSCGAAFGGYVSPNETRLATSVRLEAMQTLRATLDGPWIGRDLPAAGVVTERGKDTCVVQFQASDGYCKAVRVRLTQRGDAVFARTEGCGYGEAGLFGSPLPASCFGQAVSTGSTNGCYGVKDVVLSAEGCPVGQTWACETAHGRLTVDATGGFAFADRRSGRTYRPLTRPFVRVTRGVAGANGQIDVDLVETQTGRRYAARYAADAAGEIVVRVTAAEPNAAFDGRLLYPAAMRTEGDDRLILPISEGLGVPAKKGEHPVALGTHYKTYRGADLAMPFAGAFSDASGAGWLAIVETAEDAAFRIEDDGAGFRSVAPEWEGTRGAFGYARAVRYVFFARGGYVAACKRYRAHAKARGLVKTFAEKAKTRPAVMRLPGMADVWNFSGIPDAQVADDLRAIGADRLLMNSGNAEFLKAHRDDPTTLTSCYDDYRDMYTPEQVKKLGWKTGLNIDAWPDTAVWDGTTPDTWRRAWGVKAPDGTWTHCATICDKAAVGVMRRHVKAALAEKAYTARFIDVATAHDWDECANPAHPMDRRESRAARVELLLALGEEFNLVVGSEQGHDATAAVCDYYEGMMSPAQYRVPDAGRDLVTIWTNVPSAVAEVQVNEKVRLPLWELVYHDCTCAHWYWGDYSNKIPKTWDRRDLLNALYATAPMFLIVRPQWIEQRARFERTCRLVLPIARRCGFAEMTNHEILSADRSVQRSTFANGVTVTVNFGSAEWRDPATGKTIAAGGVIVI